MPMSTDVSDRLSPRSAHRGHRRWRLVAGLAVASHLLSGFVLFAVAFGEGMAGWCQDSADPNACSDRLTVSPWSAMLPFLIVAIGLTVVAVKMTSDVPSS
jgi:hypothetical protein